MWGAYFLVVLVCCGGCDKLIFFKKGVMGHFDWPITKNNIHTKVCGLAISISSVECRM